MQVAQTTTERLVLRGSSPIFRPFFLAGLVLLSFGTGFLVWAMASGLPLRGPLAGNALSLPVGGLVTFLLFFGSFFVLVPFFGALPYQKRVVVDRVSGHLTRSDRSLRGSREDVWTLDQVQGVEIEELKHVDGDCSYTALLKLESGKTVALDRFVDRQSAERIAQILQTYLAPLPTTT
jgi:hypothetical protein